MNISPENPSSNQLGPGLTEEQVLGAVVKSGYPLQTIVGDLLRAKLTALQDIFQVQEEWSYIDRDTKELRTIDILVDVHLSGWESQPRVRPHLNLLIECKQSPLPYVFFETKEFHGLLNFPTIAGLRKDRVIITTDDDPSSWNFSVPHALDLHRDPYNITPRACHTLSKCVRKGAEIELSGSDAYNGLVLPLVKSLQHFVDAHNPVKTAWYFDCYATLAIGVLDAPMISVSVGTSAPTLTAVPWVRILRHEYEEEAERFEREQLRVIDVVHKDFLDVYFDKYLVPFSKRFSERVLRHTTELATGFAYAPDLRANSWDTVESRMKPRSPASKISRVSAVARRLLGFFTRRGKRL